MLWKPVVYLNLFAVEKLVISSVINMSPTWVTKVAKIKPIPVVHSEILLNFHDFCLVSKPVCGQLCYLADTFCALK